MVPDEEGESGVPQAVAAQRKMLRAGFGLVSTGLGLTLVVRAAAMVLAFPCSLLASRLLIGEYGADTFGVISLVATLPALLPFADLGLGTGMMNATTDLRARSAQDRSLRLLSSGFLLLGMAGAVVIVLSLLAGLTGSWTTWLGTGATSAASLDINVGATLVGVLFGVGVAGSGFGRVLQGLELNATVAGVAGAGPVVNLGLIFLLTELDAGAAFATTTTIAVGVLLCLAYALVVRRSGPPIGLTWTSLRRHVPERRDLTDSLRIAIPAVIVSVGVAMAFQSDRLILSHLTNAANLAQYAAVFPLYSAAIGVMIPVGQQLWPRYRRIAASGESIMAEYRRHLALFSTAGVFVGAALIVVGPLVVEWMSNGEIVPPLSLYAGAAALVALQYAHFPSAMLLTDEAGFRLQAIFVAMMAVCKIGITILLAGWLGATGAFLGSALALGLLQVPLTLARAWPAAKKTRTEADLPHA